MMVPQYAGSPAMTVVAAIPLGHGNEYICTVISIRGAFGTVHAYRGENATGDVVWHADTGHYDIASLGDALRDMIRRSGIQVI
jgi:hypothetical protein